MSEPRAPAPVYAVAPAWFAWLYALAIAAHVVGNPPWGISTRGLVTLALGLAAATLVHRPSARSGVPGALPDGVAAGAVRRRAVAAGARLPGLATAAVSVLVAAACAGSGRSAVAKPGAARSPAEGVVVDRLVERCFDTTSGSDADADGLDDACELALASSFAPALVVESGHCGWDGAARRPAGGYVFGVQPTGVADRVRIAYLPAYVRDCGWSGAKCLLLYRACEGHSGDSEMIALEAQPGPGRSLANDRHLPVGALLRGWGVSLVWWVGAGALPVGRR